jgi:hypothetical protein
MHTKKEAPTKVPFTRRPAKRRAARLNDGIQVMIRANRSFARYSDRAARAVIDGTSNAADAGLRRLQHRLAATGRSRTS